MAKDKRITIRFNAKEQAELELLKANFHIPNDSEALKTALSWVNHYLKSVTETFFPPTHDVVLVRKTKISKLRRKVF